MSASSPVTTSPTIGALALALSKAQGEMTHAGKDRQNTFLKSSYATLESCWDAARPHLAKNELAVIQAPQPGSTADTMGLVTVLAHSSGEWVRSEYEVQSKQDGKQVPAQIMGSLLTYLRRYAFNAMVGVTTGEEDDDAEGSRGPSRPTAPPVEPSAREKYSTLANRRVQEGKLTKDEGLELLKTCGGDYAAAYEKLLAQ